jgi:hypothetical protein
VYVVKSLLWGTTGDVCGGETHPRLGTECCGGGVVAGNDTDVGGALVIKSATLLALTATLFYIL